MSRIEKALEKATKIRQVGESGKSAEIPSIGPDIFKTEALGEIDNPYLVTISDPHSPIAEEYRKLKSMVVKLTKMGTFHNTLMVTSALGGDGKSVTALNLAITLAQGYDYTVLLVDADLRQPSLHEYLGIQPKLGLIDCLTRGVDIGSTLIKTGIGKLAFLPSGSKASNPVELLSSGKMGELVKEMKHRYADRYVIFDTLPVLPFAEVLAMGSFMDGVIFVVREGYSPVQNIKEALGILEDANVLGVVYNDVSIDRFNGHYNYYKSYYYQGGKE